MWEDAENIREVLKFSFEREGFVIHAAEDGEKGLKLSRLHNPHLVILDTIIPKMDGLEACRVLRSETDSAILMLTAKTEEIDRIVGLELGADNYVSKPFNMRELIARAKAILRHPQNVTSSTYIGEDGSSTAEEGGRPSNKYSGSGDLPSHRGIG